MHSHFNNSTYMYILPQLPPVAILSLTELANIWGRQFVSGYIEFDLRESYLSFAVHVI